jgi:hypothetical protein
VIVVRVTKGATVRKYDAESIGAKDVTTTIGVKGEATVATTLELEESGFNFDCEGLLQVDSYVLLRRGEVVDMIYDTCSWRPLYVEAQHGIRTLWRRDSVGVSDVATMEAEVDTIEKQEAQRYCHRRGEHTCSEASSGSVAASAKAAIAN